jgi:hypothetical protein
MAQDRPHERNSPTRGLAVVALLCVHALGIAGASALLLCVSSASALARGGHHGGGFHGRGFHGAGFGLGFPYYGYGGYYPYYGDLGVCYEVRQRVLKPYGWRIRRVSICE